MTGNSDHKWLPSDEHIEKAKTIIKTVVVTTAVAAGAALVVKKIQERD